MCTGRRCHGAPQSAFRHSRSTKFPSVQHDKLWPTSIFVRRPSCPALTARTSATNHFDRPFQALSKNVFIWADIALSALEKFLSNELYKFTYLLTYLLTAVSAERLLALPTNKQLAILHCVWWPGRQLACPVGLLGGRCDCRSFAGQDAFPHPTATAVECRHYQRADDAVMGTSLHPCRLLIFSCN